MYLIDYNIYNLNIYDYFCIRNVKKYFKWKLYDMKKDLNLEIISKFSDGTLYFLLYFFL